MDSELGETSVQSSAEEDSSEEEEEEESSSEEEEEEEKSKVAESSGSSSAASSSSSEDEEQGDGSPQQPATPLEAGSPGQTSLTGQMGQVEDGEQAEQVHGDIGSPLATGVEEEADESSQFPSTQQLFGADSSGSESSSGESPEAPPMSPEVNKESPARNGEERETRTVEGLFGDTAELSSSEDERMSAGEGAGLSGDGVGLDDEHREGQEDVEEEVPRINVEIPRCVANLGSDIHFVKLPNFLSVETRPFDPELYEDEGEEDEILDEEGRARLKLKVENTIRWRYSTDESGNEIRESNARLVKWSDGTMSLYLGSEIFDIYRQPLQGEFSHLFVRQGTGLQGQAVFRSKLTFRPHSTDSQTHRKMTLSIADRFSKAQKIRVLPAVGKDPESQRLERIKREEENLKAAIRREHHKRRLREKNLQKGGLSASYLEPDRDLESEEDLGAIKSSVRSRLNRRQGDQAASDSSGSESEGEGESRLIKAKEEQGNKSHGVARRSRKLLSDDEDEDSSD